MLTIYTCHVEMGRRMIYFRKTMIARIQGKIVEIEKKSLVVDVGGVGYRVAVSASLLAQIKMNEEMILRIHHHVSDDAETLYGFKEKEMLEYFEMLLTVPSVGPRTALNILDIAPPRTLEQAVANKDVKLLTKVSGVGKKTAERILIELEGKVGKVEPTGPVADMQEEVMAVLESMGYTKSQARMAVQKLAKNVETVEDAVRYILQGKV
jgi:holliday junction DNA helicase RuvA